MSAAPLPNPEQFWAPREAEPELDPRQIEQRIGPFRGPVTTLSGGLVNTNVLVEDRVVRIYRRDAGVAALEATLVARPWSSFRVPKLLSTGADFLELEYVPHTPLLGSAEHGEAAGRALAEIHSVSLPQPGFLDAQLRVVSPFDDLVSALIDYANRELSRAPFTLDAALHERVLTALRENETALREVTGSPVLLHADFKASNLHWANDARLLVLDWEFAYSGSRLSDVGQLLRWQPPRPFVDAFARAYVAAGGTLPREFEKWAALLDLVNMAGLVANLPWTETASRRLRDVQQRIEATLALAGAS